MKFDYQASVVVEVLGQKFLTPIEMAPNEPDIMRINLAEGYTPENTIMCSHVAVKLREEFFKNLSFEEFLDLCREIDVADEIILTTRSEVVTEG